jgi:predicted peroxiredoxin
MNNYFEFFDKLSTPNQLIRKGYTGNPDDLAKRFSISRKTLYRIIDELKTRGVEVKYCRTRCSFHYANEAIIDIRFNIEGLTEMSKENMRITSGGCVFINNFSTFFFPCQI